MKINIYIRQLMFVIGLLLIIFVFNSCRKDGIPPLEQPDFISVSLSKTLIVEGGNEFELSVPLDETVETYEWTVPGLLEIIEGQGTYKIKVKASKEGGVIPERTIIVVAKRAGQTTIPRFLYKEITILLPPPILDGYKTKRYGGKTWMIENLNYSGEDGDLGKIYNNDIEKEELYGRYYTWHEAMTGIPNCTAEQNPYKNGATGVDDMGNPYTLDGSSSSFNIQVQGVCPEGWHIPNVYDWYDLVVAVKDEYNVPASSLRDVAQDMEGYIIAWDRDNGFTTGLNLTNWGFVGPYFKGSTPQLEGGLWSGGRVFSYGGNHTFPNSSIYPLYMAESTNVGFNILPGGRWNSNNNKFEQEGLYSYHWSTDISLSNNNPVRFTVGSANANLSNYGDNPLYGLNVRCVANY